MNTKTRFCLLLAILQLGLSESLESFWQITDVHWDKEYSRTGDPDNLCHGEGLVVDNGFYGNTFCDGTSALMDLSIRAMALLEPNPDFILWTGDNAPHVEFPNQTWADVYETLDVIGSQLLASFPATKILPVLGNHDTVPSDQFPADDADFYSAYLSKGNWSLLIPEDQQVLFKKGGFYAVTIKPGVKVLVLNTGLYLQNNHYVRETESDPSGQFDWFLDQVNDSRSINEKVIITSHVAPGYFATGATELNLKPTFNDKLVRLIAENADVILTIIFGHEHMDTFRLFADDLGNIKTHAFLAGPVDVWVPDFLRESQAVNAGIRLYAYDSAATLVTDYRQFYVDFMQANRNVSEGSVCRDDSQSHPEDSVCVCSSSQTPGACAQVELLYRPTQAYNVSDLSTQSMTEIYAKLRADPQAFQIFFNHSTLDYVVDGCDAICQNNYICSIANITDSQMKACLHLPSHRYPFTAMLYYLYSML